ncbi:MAG TPA: histidine phosphatase family protein [Steroidobacteraceae bacterium]|nr:histidine phosphatase family protein [Steroidobacteraceae bacterium]
MSKLSRLSAAFAALAITLSIQVAFAEELSGASLVRTLRAGGCVLVMRHASSPATLPDASTADPDNTKHERQLDEIGRNDATTVGTAIRSLRIPIGAVLSSPTYRARETLRLTAVGTPTITQELDEGTLTPNDAKAVWLRNKVAEPPRAKANTLLVTHSPNINGAFTDLTPGVAQGEMLVFRVEKGKAKLIARIKPSDWNKLGDN